MVPVPREGGPGVLPPAPPRGPEGCPAEPCWAQGGFPRRKWQRVNWDLNVLVFVGFKATVQPVSVMEQISTRATVKRKCKKESAAALTLMGSHRLRAPRLHPRPPRGVCLLSYVTDKLVFSHRSSNLSPDVSHDSNTCLSCNMTPGNCLCEERTRDLGSVPTLCL